MSSSRSTRNSGVRVSADSSLTAPSNDAESHPNPAIASELQPSPTSPEETNLLPNAGISGPIPDDFDFEGRINLPDGITRFELPLAVRIRENVAIEEFNNDSILKTVAVKNTPAPRPIDMDVGPSLKSPYYYADDEIRDLIDSEALCALFSPLPAALLREIVSGQAQRGRQKEDERQVSRDRDHDLDGSIRSRLL
ncbi:hypothetical protein C0993_002997, partial [Termitomyces sp. T159_Od127]